MGALAHQTGRESADGEPHSLLAAGAHAADERASAHTRATTMIASTSSASDERRRDEDLVELRIEPERFESSFFGGFSPRS